MLTFNRKLLLNTLIKHEALTLTDIGKEKKKIGGTVPCTYTVTDKGIAEGNRLKAV